MASATNRFELGDFLERHKVKVGSDSGIEAHLKFSDAKHPELHHSKKRPCVKTKEGGLLTLIHKSINFSRTLDSPDTLAGKHRLDHYQRLHTPKFLHRRIQSISGSSDDDDGHPHTGRL